MRVLTLVAVLSLLAGARADDALKAALQKMAGDLGRPDSLKNEGERLRDRIRAANQESTRGWRELKAKEDWERFRRERVARLEQSLGAKMGPPRNLNVSVRRTTPLDGCRVELISYQSRPGVIVTANLYTPEKPGKAMPGMILVPSHHNPKTQGELQDMGRMWARAGCLVLVLDLLGHGERRQHPFTTDRDFDKKFAVGRQDYYFRHNVAAQLQTVGESLMGWMVNDIRRGVDLLLARPGIDPKKIAVLGAVAGGGDPAAVAAALDERITAAVVFNFGGPQPETRHPLPEDAEEAFNYAGGGSWETTRNLAYSASGGFLPWVIVAIAPRRLVYAHEFAWDRDRDPVWKRLKQIYAWYGVPDHLRSAHGSGSVRSSAPGNTHCNNIGRVHRKEIHTAFKDWFGIVAEEADRPQRLSSAELAVLGKETIPPARDAARALWAENHERFLSDTKALSVPQRRALLRVTWGRLLGGVGRVDAGTVKWESAEVADRVTRQTAGLGGGAGVQLFVPPSEGRRAVTVLFGQGGAKELLRERAADVSALLRKGEAVAVLDLGGTANQAPGTGRGRTSGATSLAATALMVGRPLFADRLQTLRRALAALRTRDDIDGKRVTLWGDSTAPANAADAKLIIPLEQAQPPAAEPLGGHLALVAALFEDGIIAVRGRGGLASWSGLLESAAVHYPYDNVIPGAGRGADWGDVAAALAPVPVRLGGLVDGQNRRVPLDAARKRFASKNVTVED